MEKIETFDFVKDFLKQQEIICTANKHNKFTYFFMKNQAVIVLSENSHYSLSFEEFCNLFSKEVFYLYQPTDEGIDQLKDEAYYAWKAKGTN